MNLVIILSSVMLFYGGSVKGDATVQKVRFGVMVGKEITAAFKDSDTSTAFKSISKVAGKVSTLLGVISPALGFLDLFLSSGNSQINLLKKGFAEMNDNFDRVFQRFRDVERRILEQGLKSQYAQDEKEIRSLSKYLNEFINASAFRASSTDIQNKKSLFLTKYQNTYKVQAQNLYDGVMKFGSLADNIPTQVANYTEYHRRDTQNIMKGLLTTIIQGVKLELAYYDLVGNHSLYSASFDRWDIQIKNAIRYMNDFDVSVAGKWAEQSKKDSWEKLVKLTYHSNWRFANDLYSFLADKYDWRTWFVISYEELYGGDNHWGYQAGGFSYYRHYNRNLRVASASKSLALMDKDYVRGELYSIPYYAKIPNCKPNWWKNCRTFFVADSLYEAIPWELKESDWYPSVVVIKEDSGVSYMAEDHRILVYTKEVKPSSRGYRRRSKRRAYDIYIFG